MKMHEFFILFVLFKECIYECMKCDFFLKRMHVKIHEICLNMNLWFCSLWKMHIRMREIWFFAWCIYKWMKFFYWIWILKMHVWMHEIWFFVFFFEWCIYERMEFLIKYKFWIWMKMHIWIHKIWFFCTVWIMHLWMNESLIEYEFLVWMKMHVWVHEIWFSFVLKGAFMNA